MINFFRNRKLQFTEEQKIRINEEIERLNELKNGLFAKVGIFDYEYYIKIVIEKKCLKLPEIENTKENEQEYTKYKNIPDTITFLIIIDNTFPDNPPKILSKTTFSYPNLVDGRNLTRSIIPLWFKEISIYDIARTLPKFAHKVIMKNSYDFYGCFNLGAIYDLANYNSLLVNIFDNCKRDFTYMKNLNNAKIPEKEKDKTYTLILSDDCLVLFENLKNYESNKKMGRVYFWSTLFALSDMKINKSNKIVYLNFYSDEKGKDKQISLVVDNVILFREALFKRMNKLKISIDVDKLVKGHMQEKRLTSKEIDSMDIYQIEETIAFFRSKIEHNQLNYYVINTYLTLIGKAIEYYSAADSDENLKYLEEMKKFLSREDVKKSISQNANNNSKENNNNNK